MFSCLKKWLKWKLARVEIEELKRWRLGHKEAVNEFTEFQDASDALQWLSGHVNHNLGQKNMLSVKKGMTDRKNKTKKIAPKLGQTFDVPFESLAQRVVPQKKDSPTRRRDDNLFSASKLTEYDKDL